MKSTLSEKRLRRLDIQGFDGVDEGRLASAAPWLRLPFQLCAILALIGTATASVPLLSFLAGVAYLAALFPVHPFDLLYNLGIRPLTGGERLPRRGAPGRFGCGVASLWLVAMILAFRSSTPVLGYVLGSVLVGSATMVAILDVCVPSMIYRAVFGGPEPRTRNREAASETRPPVVTAPRRA